ncbi:MAG TPA: histidinol-phosphate transaminase [Candidatus Acidoferrum sp.]|nr:histidinol-phosphate transaminase [Candidatus Acidoferrum sp.]
MRIHRRELLRQFGTAAAATAVCPMILETTSVASDSGERLIRLNRNESAYGPSEKAKVAFQEALAEVNRYPGEDVENLRSTLATSHGVATDCITLGCGSTELMRMAAEAYLGPGKTLVAASPTFELIAQAAALVGADVRSVPLTREYAHDLGAMFARAQGTTGLIYICNPNNPTGTLTPETNLEAFLRKVPAGVTVMMDEAYHEYVAPTNAYASWASRAAAHSQLIVTRTFSKMYGIAGLRVGYAVSSAATAKRLAERRLPMEVSSIATGVALAALSDAAYTKKIAAANANDRQEFFNQVNARMLRCLDSHANFVLMRTESPGKEVVETLRSKGVLVSAGFASFEKHIRVSLGLPQDMEAFWRAWDVLMPHHPM